MLSGDGALHLLWSVHLHIWSLQTHLKKKLFLSNILVLISYGFNSYRLRVNKLELELEHFRLEVSVLLLSSLTTAVQKWIQVSQRLSVPHV